jgi:hypothetical protein
MTTFKETTLCTAKSMAASFSDEVFEVFGKAFKLELAWTGVMAGTIHLEETSSGNVWNKISDSDITVNNTDNKSVCYKEINTFKNVRIVWTRVSGTGTLAAYTYMERT